MDDAPDRDRPEEPAPDEDAAQDRPPVERHADQPLATDLDGERGDEDAGSGGEDGDNVFGPRPDGPLAGPIDPGDPDLEHVAFVLLGVAVSLLIVADLVGLV